MMRNNPAFPPTTAVADLLREIDALMRNEVCRRYPLIVPILTRCRASIESLSSRLDMTQRDFEHSTRWRSKTYNEQAEKLDEANAANASLRDKLAERDADAERYRWLRASGSFNEGGSYVRWYLPRYSELLAGSRERLDACIDVARQSAQAASQPSNPET